MKKTRHATPSKSGRRIYLIDDHPMTRYGIAQLIGAQPGLQVCGDTDNPHEAPAAVKRLQPDLVLIDLTMPGKNGLDLIKDLKHQQPSLLILVVSMHDEKVYAERALRAGANGYLMKSEGGHRLLHAIRHVLKGQVFISESIASRIFAAFAGRRTGAVDSPVGVLTEREFQVFELVGNGMTMREIGEQLHISAKTVETHRLHIVEKLDMNNTAELTKFAIRWMRLQSGS